NSAAIRYGSQPSLKSTADLLLQVQRPTVEGTGEVRQLVSHTQGPVAGSVLVRQVDGVLFRHVGVPVSQAGFLQGVNLARRSNELDRQVAAPLVLDVNGNRAVSRCGSVTVDSQGRLGGSVVNQVKHLGRLSGAFARLWVRLARFLATVAQ